MPRYVTLVNWTDQGIKTVKEMDQRVDAVKGLAAHLGVKDLASAFEGQVKEMYFVMGRYDVVVITDMPDDEAATKLALAVGAQGNVRTETLRAYTQEEMGNFLGDLADHILDAP